MKFDFIKIPAKPTPAFPDKHEHLVPAISAVLINQDEDKKRLTFKALVDSGADISIFPMDFARALNMNVD